MSQKSSASGIVGTLIFAATCALGIAATTYSVTLAYLMGASAQAQADDTTPAPPQVLLRNSLEQTLEKARNGQFGAIKVEDHKVQINNVEDEADRTTPAEVIDAQ